jgi:hypothetical protein
MCFFSSADYTYLQAVEPVSTLKTMICRKCSFQKLSPFSQGNNIRDAPVSHTHGFRGQINVFPQLNRIVLLKQNETFSNLKVQICRKYSFQNVLKSHMNPCTRCCHFQHRWFSLERYMYFFTSAE